MLLFDASGLEIALRSIAQPLQQLAAARDDTVADVHAKERIWSSLTGDRSPLDPWRMACHLWCARWFWPRLTRRGRRPTPSSRPRSTRCCAAIGRSIARTSCRWIDEARAIAREHHGSSTGRWNSPTCSMTTPASLRERAGFDAVIGNPPWEMLRNDDDEPGSAADAERQARTLSFLRQSGLYPSCDRGHLNLYQPFLERSLDIVAAGRPRRSRAALGARVRRGRRGASPAFAQPLVHRHDRRPRQQCRASFRSTAVFASWCLSRARDHGRRDIRARFGVQDRRRHRCVAGR